MVEVGDPLPTARRHIQIVGRATDLPRDMDYDSKVLKDCFYRAFGLLVQDPNNPQRIFAAIAGVGVYRSEDGGLTWSPFSTGLGGAASSSDIELATQSVGGATSAGRRHRESSRRRRS